MDYSEPGRRQKFDRHPFYIGLHFGILALSLSLMLGHVPRSAPMSGMSPSLQHCLAACMGVGSVMALIGISLGAWLDKHLDLRRPYVLGLFAAIATMLSMSAYAIVIASHSDLVGTFGGGVSVSIAVSCGVMIRRFNTEIRHLTKLREAITKHIDDP